MKRQQDNMNKKMLILKNKENMINSAKKMKEKLFGKQTANNKSNQGNIEQEQKVTTNVEDITAEQNNEVQDTLEVQKQS